MRSDRDALEREQVLVNQKADEDASGDHEEDGPDAALHRRKREGEEPDTD